MTDPRPLCALTIAGSDSGGGAGIQADLKTFAAHRVHGLSAIAALTAQNTHRVSAIHVPPTAFLRAQIDACFDDFRIGAVKLGMLVSPEVIHAVADALEFHKPRCIVLDPVMAATSGALLLDPAALDAMIERLLPLATLITPNIPEAEVLLGRIIIDRATTDAALDGLLELGANAVLLKGGHLLADTSVTDHYADRVARAAFSHDRLNLHAHGTGCTLAAAITANSCLGCTLLKACEAAIEYVHGALVHAYHPGESDIAVLDHFWRGNKSSNNN